MNQGLDSQSLAIYPSVSPVVLAVMFAAFLIGAVGPFVLCVLGSVREERAMRRYAANTRAVDTPSVANPVEANVIPATVPLPAQSMPEALLPANDAAVARAVRS